MKNVTSLLGIIGIIFSCIFFFFNDPACADELIVEKVLSPGEELRVSVDCKTFRYIKIRLENMIDSESICWRTSFYEGKERSKSEIGPLKFRTINLTKKEEDETKAIRFDRRSITLACESTDEILIHVEKGKIKAKVWHEKSPI